MTFPHRIVVAMSGGVDSSVAAALLLREGFEVVGVTLRMRRCDEAPADRSCCGGDGLERARLVAGMLGIRHYVLDCADAFEADVLRPAWEAYDRGLTPSPCLWCNERLKMGLLHDRAREIGALLVATGHYAVIGPGPDGRPALFRAADRSKDQSYFLAGLTRAQLETSRFPLGGQKKTEVRLLARSLGLPSADAAESQDACLIENGLSFSETLRLRFSAPARPGAFIDDSGARVGTHPGIHWFTVGQRHGLPNPVIGRWWTRAIDPDTAAVFLTRDETRLLCSAFPVVDAFWIDGSPPTPDAVIEVQVRSRQAPVACRLGTDGIVRLASPIRAVTPGQAAVFFDQDRVLGRAWVGRVGGKPSLT